MNVEDPQMFPKCAPLTTQCSQSAVVRWVTATSLLRQYEISRKYDESRNLG